MEIAINHELPLRYIDVNGSEEELAPLGLQTLFSSSSGVFHGRTLSVGWRVSGDGRSIEVYPLELDATRVNSGGVCLQFRLQCTATRNCVSVSETERGFVVDFVSGTGSFYTLFVPQRWLFAAENLPVSVDLVHHKLGFKPYLLKAFSSRFLVASLPDGQLIRLDRKEVDMKLTKTELKDVHKGVLSKLFSFGDRVPGSALNVDCVVSLEVLGDFEALVTYSVDNSVRLWDLNTNTCVQKLLPPAKGEYRQSPGPYIAVSGNNVAVLLASELSVYQYQDSRLNEHPNSRSIISNDLRHWSIAGLYLLQTDILVVFTLKSAAKFYLVSGGEWKEAGGYDHSAQESSQFSIEAIKRRVLDVKGPVLAVALRECGYNALDEEVDPRAVTKLLDGPNARSNWLRFDTVCKHVEARGSELLSVAPAVSTSSSLFFWLVKASGLCLLSFRTFDQIDDKNDSQALGIANTLFKPINRHTNQKLINALLSESILTTRISKVCDILKPVLNINALTELGRLGTETGEAVNQYIDSHGLKSPPHEFVGGQTRLSEFGKSAVNTLILKYAKSEAQKFALLSALCVVGLVEGWTPPQSQDFTQLLRQTLASLRMLVFVTEVGPQDIDFGVVEANLDFFGAKFALNVLRGVDGLKLLTRVLPEVKTSAQYDKFVVATNKLEKSKPLNLLKIFAALNSGQQSEAVRLAKSASLGRPWLSDFGTPPATQSEWFYRVAEHASRVGCTEAKLWLAKCSSQLSTKTDSINQSLFLFAAFLETGDLELSYTVLMRLGPDHHQQVQQLVELATRLGANEALQLVSHYPFTNFTYVLDRVLSESGEINGVPTFRLRYAFHMQRENYVAAAQAVYDHLSQDQGIEAHVRLEMYTYCLNALQLVSPESRWLQTGTSGSRTFDDVNLEFSKLKTLIAMNT